MVSSSGAATSIYQCVVIGAGAAGLTTVKHLLEQGIENVICLEQSDRLGGVFANSYDTLVLTTSAAFSMFSDFWIGDGNSHSFWTKAEAVDYWKRYAQHYGVIDKIQFSSKVVSLDKSENGWQLELNSGCIIRTQRVAMAIGNNALPFYPDWHSQLSDVEYLHSKRFRNNKDLGGKNVLVVGGGESGSDMALEASKVAKNCWISLRDSTGWLTPRWRGPNAADASTHRGVWGLPREFGATLSRQIYEAEWGFKDPVHDTAVILNKMVRSEKGVFGTFGTKSFALPRAIVHHGCKVVGEIVDISHGGKVLQTADRRTLNDVDTVIFATGYRKRVSFMPESLQLTNPRNLYKHMIHLKWRDSIVWIGWARPNFGSQFPMMEMQARFFALICAQKRTLPPSSRLESSIIQERKAAVDQFDDNAEKIPSLVDYFRFMDSLAVDIGCEPPLRSYFFTHPRLWLSMVYGPCNASQFRIRGPDSKPELANSIIEKLPVSKLTHIVKTGMKGRLFYSIKWLLPFNTPASEQSSLGFATGSALLLALFLNSNLPNPEKILY